MGLKNTTTTMVESFAGSEAGRLVRVEVLALFSTLVWVLLQMFARYRRRYSHGFFRLLIWAVYTLSNVVAPYTIGLLQAGPFRDQTFVLWGVILLLIQVNSVSLSVYSIKDIDQRKRMFVQQILQIFLVLWLIVNDNGRNKSYSATIWIFWIHSVILTYEKFGNLSNVSKKGGLVAESKVIADYMVVEHEQAQGVVNPSTMEGYSYIFMGEEKLASVLPSAPEYRVGLKEATNDEIITIDSAWVWINTHSFEPKKLAEVYKDTALSFTLFKLLKRRFCGYGLSEASLEKTLHLILHGLLSEEGKYVRAFGVIELELTFLYDLFYTRLTSEKSYYALSGLLLATAIIWNNISGAFSRHYHHSNLEQRVSGTDVIHWITIMLLASLVFVHVRVLFVTPYRMVIVDELRRLIIEERRKSREKTIFPGRRPGIKETWERKLGHYSLLEHFDYDPRNALSWLSLGMVEARRKGQKAGKRIKLLNEVIIHVLSQFKENDGKLQNGQSALARNQLGSQLSWACTLPTHIHTILVWHIGTTISQNEDDSSPASRCVAVSLSTYCAYLVVFIPEMLPGHGYDTLSIFDAVVMEAREQLAGCKTVSDRCEKLKMGDNDSTILGMGAKLGRQLIGMDPDERWKVLADFWAEFILFLAPSDNADIHAEMLAAGGEFMTHLWALLTNAGILERPSSSSDIGPLGGFNGTTAQDSAV